MPDDREKEMLELMRECSMTLRRCENAINEIWAEWTRTHGLRGIPGKELTPTMDPAKAEQRQGASNAERKVVRRVLK